VPPSSGAKRRAVSRSTRSTADGVSGQAAGARGYRQNFRDSTAASRRRWYGLPSPPRSGSSRAARATTLLPPAARLAGTSLPGVDLERLAGRLCALPEVARFEAPAGIT